jgi:UDPglucose 6-dehydrogenase
MEKTKEVLPVSSHIRYVRDAYAAVQGVDVTLILTDWSEFGSLDLERLKNEMRCAIVVDGRNMYDPEAMFESGITYVSVGRPTMDVIEDEVPLARLA